MTYSDMALEQPVRTVPRRRRRRRKKNYTPMILFPLAIFLAGFLAGWLVRGIFIPEPAVPVQTDPPVETAETQLQPPLPLDDWRMVLVNPWNPVPDNFVPSLTILANGMEVDRRCYQDLQEMLAACEGAGLEPSICSGYRTLEYQQGLFDDKIRRLQEEGMSPEQARSEAATVVAVPGTSEHHLGLALDIVDAGYPFLTEEQEETPVQKWLIENSWKYGFILRYPSGKSDITGIIYEPWRYRYVGREVAAEVYASGLCFEEYLDQFR